VHIEEKGTNSFEFKAKKILINKVKQFLYRPFLRRKYSWFSFLLEADLTSEP
jgi:hypothetical protein